MACFDVEACRCFFDPAEMQEGPDPSSEIEEEDSEAPIPIWIQFVDTEAIALTKDSE
jgi:hypothetical protein